MGSPGRPLTGRPRVVGVRFNVTDNRHGSSAVSSVAFKPGDSDTLVSGSWDNTIKIWHLPSGECQATFTGHRYIFCAVTCMGSLGDPSGVAQATPCRALRLGRLLHCLPVQEDTCSP